MSTVGDRWGAVKPYDAWVLANLTSGRTLNGEINSLSDRLKPMAAHLNSLDKKHRTTAFQAMAAMMADAADLIQAIADQSPTGPAPARGPVRRFATAADVRRVSEGTSWVWDGWIPGGSISGLAGLEGSGKTRLMADLARRVWLGLPWPDGQPATLPKGTPTLWICADGHQRELVDLMSAFGVPDEAVHFPASPEEPNGGTCLDDEELVGPGGVLEDAIATIKPGFTIVDTLTYATSRDLCSQDQIAELKKPLVRICQAHNASILLSLHVSKEGQALGRRIKGITRVLSHVECPDPTEYKRLRFWVEKSHAKKPEAIGVAMTDSQNLYDEKPPAKVDPNKGGAPPDKKAKASRFIIESLAESNDQTGNDLARACAEKFGVCERTAWRSIDDLAKTGDILKYGGPGTGGPVVLHLNRKED